MNRRNFLKLFGIGLLPIPAFAVPATHHGNLTVIMSTYDSHVILVNGKPSDPYCRRKGHQKEYYRSDLGLSYHPMTVSNDDVITVRAINGVEVSFTGHWSKERERFASVYIGTSFADENDQNFNDVIKLEAVL